MVDTTTFSYTGPTRIGDLYLYGKDKKNKYMYRPQDDITVLELSLIMRLFISALPPLSSIAYYDYWGYVKEHNLERHFVEEEE